MNQHMRQQGQRNDDSPMRVQGLYRRAYPLRVLGMGLAMVPALVVLRELDAGWIAWAWTLFCGVVWPHVAWLHSRSRRDPYKAELTNFMIDSALAGSLAPVMHFNLLPTVVIATLATADKMNSGVRGLWPRSLLGMAAALLISGALNGFRTDIHSSTAVVLACLPLMVIHTLAVSASSYRLIRKVQAQNKRLDELTRVDALTGLESRRHWQEQVAGLLARSQQAATPATMLLIDVDLFKDINDRHGHATGDDVLRGIAGVIRTALPAGGHAGRIGGDEFAAALPVAIEDATRVAERIRAAVEELAFPRHPPLRASVSIGIAMPPAGATELREWIEAADRALYRAKAAGRNRSHAATAAATV